ncbi:MAG: glycosyltransferase [Actinomycetota bacterium]|nr:glycosyltransferase [Actinomycetota bacterium]
MLAAWSIVLTAQGLYSAALSLYAWEDEERRTEGSAPETFEPPRLSFTVLLPARHEQQVIGDTIQRMADLNYPRHLVQVLVVIEHSDIETIAVVRHTLEQLAATGVGNVRLITFNDPPINKPHGLNVGLAEATGDVVTIFDAEDEPHPDILNVVNTVMLREHFSVTQCGVQLMNYSDHWFSALNVLEYFFWFKSRLHYHATRGVTALGGNTVFIKRELLLDLGGWDANCLTEDADLGIRLSAKTIPIRMVYDDRYVTREETPHSVREFIKQRTRWDQGFFQVLSKGEWRRLTTRTERRLALYTLAFPFMQALMMLYVPITIYTILFVKVPVPVAMIATLPLYMVLIQYLISILGLYEFTSAHGLKPSVFAAVKMFIVYLPYQWLLAYAALRAIVRQLLGINTWDKTTHVGSHRTSASTSDSKLERGAA